MQSYLKLVYSFIISDKMAQHTVSSILDRKSSLDVIYMQDILYIFKIWYFYITEV